MTLSEAISEDHFFTLQREGSGLYKEKGSKFLGYAYPVHTVDQALDKIEKLKSELHDARHFCFAYRIDPKKPEVRFNDDGEPSNSAGMPIYNQLLSHEVWNVAVVVVRYFGGTKLGVPGLINAYREAANEALASAGKKEEYITETIRVRFPYSLMSAVLKLVRSFEAAIIKEEMAEDAGYTLEVREGVYSSFVQKLSQYHKLTIA